MIRHLIFCSSVFLAFAFMAEGFADEHFPFLAQVVKESVNVRAGPNTNFEKIDKLTKGAEVVVLGRSYEWYKIQPLPTTKLYIRSDYLKIKEGQDIAIVMGDKVNVRAGASSTSSALGQVRQGTMVTVLEDNQGWARIGPVRSTVDWVHQ
ncbi:MAG: SH3 domain-containing protein, partial [Candidatus Omnitrophica bacterium]|nr:SH3 domain-containing protein [Candidatus Omnitrophota bacterium]